MLTTKTDIPVDAVVVDILRQVKAVAWEMAAPYFLIGARAIDLLLHNLYGFNTYRPTMDTDFAVALASWAKSDEFKDRLVGTGKFKVSAGMVHQLYYLETVPIDLVPFGGLEGPRGQILWPPDSSQVMSVAGFDDISAAAQDVRLRKDGLMVRVASLPGMVMRDKALAASNNLFNSFLSGLGLRF